MNGAETFAASVQARIEDSQRGLPVASICWITALTVGSAAGVGRSVSVSIGNDLGRSTPVLTWSQTFHDRVTAGAVRVGDRVKVSRPPNGQPLIDDVYVSAPLVTTSVGG